MSSKVLRRFVTHNLTLASDKLRSLVRIVTGLLIKKPCLKRFLSSNYTLWEATTTKSQKEFEKNVFWHDSSCSTTYGLVKIVRIRSTFFPGGGIRMNERTFYSFVWSSTPTVVEWRRCKHVLLATRYVCDVCDLRWPITTGLFIHLARKLYTLSWLLHCLHQQVEIRQNWQRRLAKNQPKKVAYE